MPGAGAGEEPLLSGVALDSKELGEKGKVDFGTFGNSRTGLLAQQVLEKDEKAGWLFSSAQKW